MRHLWGRASIPWVCLGDFNEILSSNERNGRIPKPLWPIQDFQTTLLHYGLVDLGFQGYRYTWRNRRHGNDFVEQWLERVYASEDWRELYPQAKVLHTTAAYSDHNPILLTTEPTILCHHRKTKLHHFKEKWVAHLEYEKWIRTLWECLFLQHSGARILGQIIVVWWTGLGSPQLRSYLRTKWCTGQASYNTNKLTSKNICIEWQQKAAKKCKAVKK